MPRVTVTTPSRLHFGLFAFADADHAFGGVGAMIDRPGLRLRVSGAERFAVAGPLSARTRGFAERFSLHLGLAAPPACRVEVLESPPEHAGLGLGTQLGLAVAAGLDGFLNGSARPAEQLAPAVGRGGRSAVGTLGFDRGGLIVDGGHAAAETLGRLEARRELPAAWRFVLITPPGDAGLSGKQESDAFGRLAAMPPDTTQALRRLALESMLPAIDANDFDGFARALGEYGRRAGECFASVQGGPFASPAIARLVAELTGLGFPGAGQSSWGPTVFAATPSPEQADDLRTRLTRELGHAAGAVTITTPSRTGARVAIED